jgi:hypothetical protein
MIKGHLVVLTATMLLASGVATQPASANTDPVRICSNNRLGGQFYCGGPYGETGETWHYYPNGAQQIWVVGMDHSAWTRDTGSGDWGGWVSYSGTLYSGIRSSNDDQWIYSIAGIGPNGQWYYRDRQPDHWTDWHMSGWLG